MLSTLNKPAFPVVDDHIIARLVEQCHGASVANGWWSDLKTGMPLQRNFGELQMLICTEVMEAHDAVMNEGLCDKPGLEDLPGEVEELADIVIRICDLAGGFKMHAFAAGFAFTAKTRVTDAEYSYLTMFKLVSRSFDAARRTDSPGASNDVIKPLVMVVRYCERRAELAGYDLLQAIQRKMAYNAQREDHKPENRLKDGGKKL